MSQPGDPDPLKKLTDDLDHLEQKADESLKELQAAIAARRSLDPAGTIQDPIEIHKQLLAALRALDTTEACLSPLSVLRATAQRIAEAAEDLLEDRWNEASTQAPSGLHTGDLAPRERYARNDLATLRERRLHRRAMDTLSLIESILDVARTTLRGCQSHTRAAETAVSLANLESRLSRGPTS